MQISNPRNSIKPFVEAREKLSAPKLLELSLAALVRGLVIMAVPGGGKTALLAMIVYTLLWHGMPGVIIDPKGVLKRLLLRLILRLPFPVQELMLSRLRIWSIGHPDYTYPLPFYYAPGDHDQRSQRLLDEIRKVSPALEDRPLMGWPSVVAVGRPVGAILSATGCQVTEALDLLTNVGTSGSIWNQRLVEAGRVVPDSVQVFRQTYLQWPANTRRERRYAFEAHILPFVLSASLKAIVGASSPIDFGALEAEGATLIVDTSPIEETLVRDLLTVHLFQSFLNWIRHRPSAQKRPWYLLLEEAAILMRTAALVDDVASLANEFRNDRLCPIISFQSLMQLHQDMRELLYSFGTHVIGAVASPEEAELAADFLMRYQPWMVKHEQAVYGRFDRVIDFHPEFFRIEEQRRMLADQLRSQQGRQFFVRRYLTEATVDPIIHRIISTVELPDTRHISEAQLEEAEEENVATYATRVSAILAEISKRLPRASGQKQVASGKQPPSPPKQLS